MTRNVVLGLTLLAERVALCRFPAEAPIPAWIADAHQFLSVTRTPTELSIVVDERAVPLDVDAERDYHALRLEGPMPLDLVGVIAALATPLADAGIPMFPVATFDTDYVLVRGAELPLALSVLRAVGHVVGAEASCRL